MESVIGDRSTPFARPWTPEELAQARFLRPLEAKTTKLDVVPGQSLQAMLDAALAQGGMTKREFNSPGLSVLVGGVDVPRDHWRWVYPKAGAIILVRIRLRGGGQKGKSTLRLVLTLAVAVLSAWAGPFGATALNFVKGTDAFMLASGLISATVGIVANALVNAIAPVPQPEQLSSSPTYEVSGTRNPVKLYAACNLTIGHHRVTPPLATHTFSRVYGDKTVLYGVVQWHVGKCTIEELKNGDTPLANYEYFDVEHRLLGEPYHSKITLVPNVVVERPEQIEIRQETGWIARVFPRRAFRLSFDIGLPGGLYETDSDGETDDFGVDFNAQYRAVGSSAWVDVPVTASPHMISPGYFEIREKTPNALRRTFEWAPPTGVGDYEVQIRRLKADANVARVSASTFLVCLRGDRHDTPVTNDDLCISAFRAISTPQVNGQLEGLNGIVKPIIPERDGGGAWTIETTSRNPAAWMRWLHTGPAISPAQRRTPAVFDASLDAWHDYCVLRGLTIDHVVDYATSVEGLAQMIAAAGNAHVGWQGGKRSIVIDDVKEPTQLFTASSVQGFRGLITYPKPVHALRGQFINAAKGYQPDEVIAYADGYTKDTAVNYETMDVPYKTDATDVWRVLRRVLKRAEIRRAPVWFTVDWEFLKVRFGRRALVEHFALQARTQSGWIETVTLGGGDVVGAVLDETVRFEPGKSYGVYVRRVSDGVLALHVLSNPATGGDVETDTVSFAAPAASGTAPTAGDHYAFGEIGKTVFDGQVIGISPNRDDTAGLALVPYSTALFSSDAVTAGYLTQVDGSALLMTDGVSRLRRTWVS